MPWVLQALSENLGASRSSSYDARYYLMSVATLAESVYEAAFRQTNNEFLVATLRQSLRQPSGLLGLLGALAIRTTKAAPRFGRSKLSCEFRLRFRAPRFRDP